MPSGAYVRTLGYFTPGDGGAATYRIVAGGTGTNDGAFHINLTSGLQAKLILENPQVMHVRQAGVVADGDDETPTDDSARFTVLEASDVAYFDLGGLSVYTTRVGDGAFAKKYFNGTLYQNSSNGTTHVKAELMSPVVDLEVQRPRTKSPVLDWKDREILWLGTSIPATGYTNLIATTLEATIFNLCWAGSAATYSFDNDPDSITTVKRLSMTEDDRLAGVAAFGNDSAYGTDFGDPVTQASAMTADWRIKKQFQENGDISVVVLDHNHNDRGRAPGTLLPTARTITAVTKGATTPITVDDATGIAVGDAVIGSVTGIASMAYFAHRVQAKTGNQLTINLDSSGFAGAASGGTLYEVDRNTIKGAWHFLIYYIRMSSVLYGNGAPEIILVGCPSMFTGGSQDSMIQSTDKYIKEIADFFDLSFFDLGFYLDIKLHDNQNYFEDTIHPTTDEQKQVLANHWIAWMQGGTQNPVVKSHFLPAAKSPNDRDNQLTLYSRFLGGYGTPISLPSFVETVILEDDFSDNTLPPWTAVSGGLTPVIVNAPWNAAEKALSCTSTLANNVCAAEHVVTMGNGRSWQFKFELPDVAGLTVVSPREVVICALRSSGGYYEFGLRISDTGVTPYMAVRMVPNGVRKVLNPRPDFDIVADQDYLVRIEAVKATDADNPGYLNFYVDDELVGGPYVVEDADGVNDNAQDPIALIRVGALGSTTGQNFTVFVSDIRVVDLGLQETADLYPRALSYYTRAAEPEAIVSKWAMLAPQGRIELMEHIINWAKGATFWDKLHAWWLINYDEQSSSLNLVDPDTYQLTRHGGATFTADRWWSGNGTTGYYDTHYNLSTGGWTTTNAHLGLSIPNLRLGAANKFIVGVLGAAGSDLKCRLNPAAANLAEAGAPYKANALARFGTTTDNGIDGHPGIRADWMMERTAGNEQRLWRNDVLRDTLAEAMVSWPNWNLNFFRSSTFYTDDSLQWVTVGETLTEAEWDELRSVNHFWLQEIGALT